MMASGEFSPAWFQLKSESSRPQTYFTKYLVDVVETGIADQGEGLRLGAVFDTTADLLVRDGKPEPGCSTTNKAGHFIFAHNTAKRERGRDVSTETVVPFRAAMRGAMVSLRIPTPCAACAGEGRAGGRECPTCAGSGESDRYRTLSTQLRPGVADGERVRLDGKGWEGPGGGPPGDLHVTVHVDTDPVFERSGNDLMAKLAISHSERAQGGTVSLRLPDTWVGVPIPPRTAYGTVLRVPKRGLPTAGEDTGDLLVTLEATPPVDEASDAKLRPSRVPSAPARPPRPTVETTTYRWSIRRRLGFGLAFLLVFTIAALVIVLQAIAPGLRSLPTGVTVTPAMMTIAGAAFPFVRRFFAWRRAPLMITDDGVTYVGFGFLSWTDIASVWPSTPGQPWIQVVLRRTALLSNGRPNPLAVPSIMLSDLRGQDRPIEEALRAHCPSLVINPRP